MDLLSIDSDPKTSKSNAIGEYLTAIVYLLPSTRLCPFSRTCLDSCLVTAGNPVYLRAKLDARRRRTELFMSDRQRFIDRLSIELERFIKRCDRLLVKPAVRLNGTSDIVWERIAPQLFERFPVVTYYDYTKIVARTKPDWRLPANYDLTLSYSGLNTDACIDYLNRSGRVAIVFKGYGRAKPLPGFYRGYPVANGDSHDLTFTRNGGQWLGLRAKGSAKVSRSKFIVDPQSEDRHNQLVPFLT